VIALDASTNRERSPRIDRLPAALRELRLSYLSIIVQPCLVSNAATVSGYIQFAIE
jgi:hypothetical protein